MNKSPRQAAYYIVLWQAIVVVLIAFAFSIWSGWQASYSALLGGGASVLPSFLFARKLFKTTAARDAQKIVTILFAGEFLKLILSGALLVIMIMLLPIKVLPLVIGFAGAHLGFWIAPLTREFRKRESRSW